MAVTAAGCKPAYTLPLKLSVDAQMAEGENI